MVDTSSNFGGRVCVLLEDVSAVFFVSEFQLKQRNRFADFHRYLWETPAESGASSEDHANAAFQAYKLACLHANQHLDPTHRTRLGLALNFSVFYHEVLNSPERACHVAKFAFDQAVEYSQAHPGEVCNDEALGVMQLLQNNLIAWMQETR